MPVQLYSIWGPTMSDDIPTYRPPALGPTQRQVSTEASFNPNDFQQRVKARFWRRLEEMSHVYDRETAFKSKDAMLELAGTPRVFQWLQEDSFASWFSDSDYIGDLIQSQAERSVRTLVEVRDDEDTSDGDRLKAARTLLELADAFPGRKSEVRFIDDQLEGMSTKDAGQTAEISKVILCFETGCSD